MHERLQIASLPIMFVVPVFRIIIKIDYVKQCMCIYIIHVMRVLYIIKKLGKYIKQKKVCVTFVKLIKKLKLHIEIC